MKYVPLSFISTKEAIETQIKNTVIFKTVFEEFKNIVPLDELILSTQYGYTASAKKYGTHRLLRITDINNGRVDWGNIPFCNCERSEIYSLKSSDILIARTGNNISYLVDNSVPQNTVFASYLIRIVCDVNKIIPEYLYLFLNSYAFWPQILLKQSGALLQNVNAKRMRQLLIPICPIDVQLKIVNNDSHIINKKINTNKNALISIHDNDYRINKELSHSLELIKQLRQAFLREAMQGKLVKQDPNDEPASELLKRIKSEKEKLIKESKLKKEKELPPIKEDEIPYEIPKNWIWCRLGEITNYGTSPKAEPSDFVNGIWVLDLEDIEKETSRLLSKIRFPERKSSSTKSVFKKNNVLYSKLRPYLDKVLVADEDGVCTTEILPLKCFAGLNPFYFRYTLKRPDFIMYVNSVTKGMKMPRLGTKEGKLALIPLPPFKEQQRIVTKLDQLMKLCDELEKNINKSKEETEQLLRVALKEALETK